VVYTEVVSPLVDVLFDGVSSTVLSYGASGTGKTFTVHGSSEKSLFSSVEANERAVPAGVAPRAVDQIFDRVERRGHRTECMVRISSVQCYHERLMDLLATEATAGQGGQLRLRECAPRGSQAEGERVHAGRRRGNVFVDGLTSVAVGSRQEARACIEKARRNCAIEKTRMSSLGCMMALVTTIEVETRAVDGAGASSFSIGKLSLVDMPASNRVKVGVSGAGQRGAAALSAFGNVLLALTGSGACHVPYRDSQLTRMIQGSLGGESLCAFIAHVAADTDSGENISTLRYATRARAVKNTPRECGDCDCVLRTLPTPRISGDGAIPMPTGTATQRRVPGSLGCQWCFTFGAPFEQASRSET
jgi:hypothetical protein